MIEIHWRSDPCSPCIRLHTDLESAIADLLRPKQLDEKEVYRLTDEVRSVAADLVSHLDEYHQAAHEGLAPS